MHFGSSTRKLNRQIRRFISHPFTSYQGLNVLWWPFWFRKKKIGNEKNCLWIGICTLLSLTLQSCIFYHAFPNLKNFFMSNYANHTLTWKWRKPLKRGFNFRLLRLKIPRWFHCLQNLNSIGENLLKKIKNFIKDVVSCSSFEKSIFF